MHSAVYHPPFAGFSCPLTAPCRHCRAANRFNTHEALRCRPTTWMVSGFLPHIDPAIAKYPNDRGNSMSVCKVELMSQYSECLFEGWNETYADQLPMEFADGKIRLTHVVLLPCPSLISRRQISYLVTPFFAMCALFQTLTTLLLKLHFLLKQLNLY